MRRLALFITLSACHQETSPSEWTLVAHDQPAALLSLWGSDDDDVWVVGGRSELGGGPTVLRYRQGWTRVETGQSNLDLWWVFGLSANDLFFGGSGGTILRFRDGAFERMTTPRTGTIFGIWGTSGNDVWAVGDGGAAGAIVWHFDGAEWREPPLPPGVPSRVFKVEGRGRDDVWMACGDGSVLHWQGTAIERLVTGVVAPLFSIVTTPNTVVAVGGANNEGQIVERGSEWAVAPLAVPAHWRGATARDDTVFAVGEFGLVATRDANAWRIVSQRLTQEDLHAGWIDPDGGLWVVGGDFDRSPLTARGALAYFGTNSPNSIEELP